MILPHALGGRDFTTSPNDATTLPWVILHFNTHVHVMPRRRMDHGAVPSSTQNGQLPKWQFCGLTTRSMKAIDSASNVMQCDARHVT